MFIGLLSDPSTSRQLISHTVVELVITAKCCVFFYLFVVIPLSLVAYHTLKLFVYFSSVMGLFSASSTTRKLTNHTVVELVITIKCCVFFYLMCGDPIAIGGLPYTQFLVPWDYFQINQQQGNSQTT